MKKQLKEAKELVALIWDQYNHIDFCGSVSNSYHDDIRLQADCASDEYDEMEEYVRRKDKECVDQCLENLQKTLTYCKAVIALQKAEADLPPSVFG